MAGDLWPSVSPVRNIDFKDVNEISNGVNGFTLIEAIITIVVVSVFVASIALCLEQNVSGLIFSSDFIRALNLAHLEVSKINNLSYNDSTLADGYNTTTSNYEGYPYDLNRAVNYVPGTSKNLKKVEVTLYPTGTTDTLVESATYVADVSSGSGSGGASPGQGDVDYLAVTGGSISKRLLQNITLGNSANEAITIVGVTVTFSGQSGIKLKKIEMNGSQRWDGTASSGEYVELDTSFQLSASTTYSDTCQFTFSKNLTSATITFMMSDATTTESYIWP